MAQEEMPERMEATMKKTLVKVVMLTIEAMKMREPGPMARPEMKMKQIGGARRGRKKAKGLAHIVEEELRTMMG